MQAAHSSTVLEDYHRLEVRNVETRAATKYDSALPIGILEEIKKHGVNFREGNSNDSIAFPQQGEIFKGRSGKTRRAAVSQDQCVARPNRNILCVEAFLHFSKPVGTFTAHHAPLEVQSIACRAREES